jgi:WD40 repeat protein
VAFSPDGTRLASGAWDATVRIWGVDRGSALVVLDRFTDDINVVAFSPNGHQLAVGSDDNLVHLVDLWTGAAERICSMVKRNLSLAEWRTYVGIGEYRRTCPALPPGPGAPTGR